LKTDADILDSRSESPRIDSKTNCFKNWMDAWLIFMKAYFTQDLVQKAEENFN